jgi:hypothetical protein
MPLSGFPPIQGPRGPHLADQPLLEALQAALLEGTIDEALAATGVHDQRRRLLPARLVVALVIAMSLWARDGLRDVLANLVQGLRQQDPTAFPRWHLPCKAALTQARQRVGPRPLRALFHRLAGPVATAATPGAFLFGLRLMAIDGSTLDLPDTPQNARVFGRPATSRGLGVGAFPQLRLVWLVEAGTRVRCDVVLRPCCRGEAPAARQLVRSLGPGMLLLGDRGLHSYDMVRDTLARGAHFLGRVNKRLILEPVKTLPDGTWLACIYPSPKARAHREDGILVRVIAYTLDDPARPRRGERYRLITSLRDPDQYPADALAAAYHERWEVATMADEVKTHQADRRPAPPIRSQRPREVVQEVYGLLLAHLALRLTMAEAATQSGIDPDRISFTGTLRVLRRALMASPAPAGDADQAPLFCRSCLAPWPPNASRRADRAPIPAS